jgi:predicted transcriptional regulator
MDTVPRPDDGTPTTSSETEAERQRRLAWEAEMIAEADADIAAGRLIDEAEIDAWIDSIGTDHELPPPRSGR